MEVGLPWRERIDRRRWFKAMLLASGNALVVLYGLGGWAGRGLAMSRKLKTDLREALYYKKLKDGSVRCLICFRNCLVRPGERGFCRDRENRGGTYYSLVHSLPCAVHIDPVEKEPAFHLLPGTEIYCLSTAGCNSRCLFCQNWHISQRSVEETDNIFLPPDKIVEEAKQREIPTISFTYAEPIAFYEYVLDTARLAVDQGIKILIHTNGTFNPAPLREVLRYTTAVTVDLKGFTEKFYRDITAMSLKPVLENIKAIRELGVWLELVNLVIPTLNDQPEDAERMCSWIKRELGTGVPIHFTRFHPTYRLRNLPPTPVTTLERMYEIARAAGLRYVYVGNLPGHRANSTYCPSCGERLVHRIHFQVLANRIRDDRCSFCGHPIPGIWG